MFEIFFQKLKFGPYTKASLVNLLIIKFGEIITTSASSDNCRKYENQLNLFRLYIKNIKVCHENFKIPSKQGVSGTVHYVEN